MFKRRSTRPGSTDASAYSRRVAAADSLWDLQDRARTGLERAYRAAGTHLERTYRSAARGLGPRVESAAFPVQEKVVWPLEDRTEKMGPRVRTLCFGAVVLVAAAAGVAGLIWAAPDGPHNAGTSPVATTAAPIAVVKAPPEKKPAAPTLHGADPVFKAPQGQTASSQVDPAKAIVKSAPATPSTSAPSASTSEAASSSTASSSSPSHSSPSKQTSALDGAPAGPAAISVARDFAGAFVVYETGGIDGAVRKSFGTTATPELAKALLKRPPRLPANVTVPKAKVLNVVPAPSHGTVYPVSVSLLRVGVTSELRLELEQLKGKDWRVTNVLG
jgi:hypothetical protein